MLPRAACSTLLCFSVLVSSLRAQDKVPAEQVLPGGTIGMLSIPDVKELKSRWEQTVWGDIFENPDMKPLWEELGKSFDEFIKEMKDDIGIEPADFKEIVQGEFTVALNRISRGKLGLLVSIEYGDAEDKLNGMLEKIEKRLDDVQAERAEHDLNGTSVVQFKKSKDDSGERSNGPSEICWCLKDGYFLLGNRLQVLESVLTRWDGENTDVLAEKDEFKAIQQRCRDGENVPALYWYVDLMSIVRTMVEAEAPTTIQAGYATILPHTGLTNLKAMGGTLDLATERYEDVSRTLIVAEKPYKGILRAMLGRSEVMSPPDWVTDKVESLYVINWDIQSAWDESRIIFDRFRGPGTFDKMIDDLANHPGAQGFHPKSDLVDQLTGTIVIEGSAAPSEEEPDAESMVFALGLKNEETMRKNLVKLSEMEGSPVEQRSFQGNTIFNWNLPDNPVQGMLVTQSALFFATNMARLEEIARGGDSYARLKDSDVWEKLRGDAPDSAAAWGIEQTGLQMERELKQLSQVIKTLRAEDESGLEKALEQALKSGAIKKYAVDSMSYTIGDERGVYMQSSSPRVVR